MQVMEQMPLLFFSLLKCEYILNTIGKCLFEFCCLYWSSSFL